MWFVVLYWPTESSCILWPNISTEIFVILTEIEASPMALVGSNPEILTDNINWHVIAKLQYFF